MDLNALTRKFLHNLQEGTKSDIGIREYIQALSETLGSFKGRTQTEQRRIAVAKQQLKEIKRHTRKLEERVVILEEKLQVLEEDKK